MSKKILITPRSLTAEGDPSLDMLRLAGYELVMGPAGMQPTEEQLLRLVSGCVGWLAGVEKISAKVLRSATDLKVISRNGTGVDNIDLETADRLGIKVCTAEGANAQSVAELTIGLIFSLVRSIPFSDACLKKGEWQRHEGIELQGKTLGVVGCGKIGGRVSRMACLLGMKVCGFDVRRDTRLEEISGFRWAELDEVVRCADVLTLHCPSQGGNPLVTAERVEMMKARAFLVNTARADLVDEAAVLSALESGHLSGYATDVFREEPPVDSELVEHSRTIVTPHIGAYTRESVSRATRIAVENLLQALAKKRVVDRNPNT